MGGGWGLLKNLAKGLVRNAGKPFGVDVVGEILADAWDDWDKDTQLQEKLRELQGYAETQVDEFLREVRVSLEEAVDLQKRISEEERAAYEAWLAQIPARIQRSWRRPSDPSGRTAPADTLLKSADDLGFLASPDLPRFKAGDRPLGNFELIQPLGGGGFSEVWLARDVQLGRRVAIKFGLSPEEILSRLGASVKTGVNPLEHEVAILRRLEVAGIRDGILQAVSIHLDRDPPSIVYDYIPDGDLSGVIRDLHHSGKSVVEIHHAAHRLILTLAEILAPVHAEGIVHRDLKPANILLRRLGSGELSPVIADFGIGGVAVEEAIRSGRTTLGQARYQTALMRGSHTPIYASPQQLNLANPDPSDDVHAIGVLWYQLLTGDLLSMAVSLPSNWMTRLKQRDIPPDFIDLIGQCLAPEREERVRDADHLRSLLRETLDAHDSEKHRSRREAEERRLQSERQDRANRERTTRRSSYALAGAVLGAAVFGLIGWGLGRIGWTTIALPVVGIIPGACSGLIAGLILSPLGGIRHQYYLGDWGHGERWVFGPVDPEVFRRFLLVGVGVGAVAGLGLTAWFLRDVRLYLRAEQWEWTSSNVSLWAAAAGSVVGLVTGLSLGSSAPTVRA